MTKAPRTLRQAVNRELKVLRPGPRRRSWPSRAVETGQRLPPLLRLLIVPAAILFTAVAGLFIPGPSWISALREPEAARELLGQLWQVTGATVGLALAVVFFVFQGIRSTRPTAMRDAGVSGPLHTVVYLGVATLIVTGLVLLGVGYEAPAGWSAAWATSIGALSITSVAFVFAVALQASDPSRLHLRRMAAISRRTAQEIEAEARLRVGLSILDRLQSDYGFKLVLWDNRAEGPARTLSPISGVVSNVDLNRLRQLCSKGNSVGTPPTLLAYIGREVNAGDALLIHDNDSTSAELAAQIVSVRKRPTADAVADLADIVDELHDEATQAIRGVRLAEYRQLAETQAALVLSIPEAWEREFGQEYTDSLASSVFPLSMGPLDRIGRNLYEQVVSAISVQSRELALAAAFQPLHIATRASRVQAPALVQDMMQLCRSLLASDLEGRIAELVRDHVWLNFSHLMQLTMAPVVEDARQSEARRRQSADLISHGFMVMAGVAKDAVDRRDVKTFGEVSRTWEQINQFWLPEHAAEYMPESLEKELASSILAGREEHRFLVASWLLHRLFHNADDAALILMLDQIRANFSSPNEVCARAAGLGTMRHRGSLSDWIMSDLPSGEVHVIDSSTPLLNAAAMLMLISSAGKPALDPSPWVLNNRAALHEALDRIEGRKSLHAALSPSVGDVISAIASLRLAVDLAADRQGEIDDAELIAASVSDSIRSRFYSAVSDSWTGSRSMLALLSSAGSRHVQDEGPVPPTRLALLKTLELKMWAVDPDAATGLDQLGQQLGRALANGENRRLTERLAPGQLVAEEGETDSFEGIEDRLRSVVEKMRTEGYRPSLVIHGSSWRLVRQLPVEPLPDPALVHPGAKGIRGMWQGLLVAQVADYRGKSPVVVDARAWGGVNEWTESAGGGLVADLTTYSPESALELLEAQPGLLGDEMTQDQKVLELQRRILVDVSACVEIRVDDERAARSLTEPSKEVE